MPKNNAIYFRNDSSNHTIIRTLLPIEYLSTVLNHNTDIRILQYHPRVLDYNELINTNAIIFQRMFHPSLVRLVHHYYAMHRYIGYKMIYELDDLIFGFNETVEGGNKDDGLPSYNEFSTQFDEILQNSAKTIIGMMDELVVTTDYLAKYIRDKLGFTGKINIIKNSVPRYLSGDPMIRPYDKVPEKIRVGYINASQHYNNEHHLQGDWNDAWIKWLLSSIDSGKVEFFTCDQPPYFLEGRPVGRIGPSVYYNYFQTIRNANLDLIICPMIPNKYNACKSDLTYITAASLGIPCVGTVFSNLSTSPFDECYATVLDTDSAEEIDSKIMSYLQPRKYNEIVANQFNYMLANHRYLEDNDNVNRYYNLLFG